MPYAIYMQMQMRYARAGVGQGAMARGWGRGVVFVTVLYGASARHFHFHFPLALILAHGTLALLALALAHVIANNLVNRSTTRVRCALVVTGCALCLVPGRDPPLAITTTDHWQATSHKVQAQCKYKKVQVQVQGARHTVQWCRCDSRHGSSWKRGLPLSPIPAWCAYATPAARRIDLHHCALLLRLKLSQVLAAICNRNSCCA
jgi:hypothetical protein